MLSLPSIKRQLRLDDADVDADVEAYLLELEEAAIDMLEQHLNRKLYEDQAAIDADPDATVTALVLPPSVKRAGLMLVSDMYENRGVTSLLSLNDNPVFDKALGPYRIYPNGY
ncbi:head-tail connector protein [Rheinheimera sp.]|uniref:head-tail connector protein n=1 Tax=Rheinheimera sp. TaxID=1869214 RepID=UPI0027323131|nr:head-tail connector protein [Rheinheimera sp.]MDP2715536.1 head-tail connector protein [Rheinheimera sp.]